MKTELIQYAVEGYKVRAYRFLVKPIDYDDFVFQVKELFVRLNQRGESNLIVTKDGQAYAITIEDILYIEVMNHTLTYHCTKYDITASGTMARIEKRLKDHCFVRIHNSYAVNMRSIEKVKSQSVILKDGTELPLARSKNFLLVEPFLLAQLVVESIFISFLSFFVCFTFLNTGVAFLIVVFYCIYLNLFDSLRLLSFMSIFPEESMGIPQNINVLKHAGLATAVWGISGFLCSRFHRCYK